MLTGLSASAPPAKELLKENEAIINPYYMHQLLEYGIKLASKTVELYKSKDGVTLLTRETLDMTNEFRRMNENILARYFVSIGPDQDNVKELAERCNHVARELFRDLDELRVDNPKSLTQVRCALD